MTAEAREVKDDQVRETEASGAESIALEAEAGKPGLVKELKDHAAFLKAGGSSGITGEFGKPILVTEASESEAHAPMDRTFLRSLDGEPAGSPGLDLNLAAPVRGPDVSDARADRAEAPDKGLAGLEKERAHLKELVDKKIDDPDERKRFLADMAALEKRGVERSPPLSPEEVANTYKEVSRLLEAKDKPGIPLKASDRILLAEQVMHKAASPTSVDQGSHSTCNVATIEARTYTTDPSKAAKLVADVATTGKLEVAGPPPSTVKLDAKNLKPDEESLTRPTPDGKRDYAGQIFQVTAVNIHWATHGLDYEVFDPKERKWTPHHAEPGMIRYEDRGPESGAKPPDDSGERLSDYSRPDPSTGKPPAEVIVKATGEGVRAPLLNAEAVVGISNAITGRDGKDVLLAHPSMLTDGTGVDETKTEAGLNNALANLKEAGKLPIIVAVHTDNYPFHSDGHAAGGMGGGHAVNITDYDPGPPPRVAIDNQWGADADRGLDKGLTVSELFHAMIRPSGDRRYVDESVSGDPFNRERLKKIDGLIKDKDVSRDEDRLAVEDALRKDRKELEKKIRDDADLSADEKRERLGMMPRLEKLDHLRLDVAVNRRNGTPDYLKEVELLRLELRNLGGSEKIDLDVAESVMIYEISETASNAFKHFEELKKSGRLDHVRKAAVYREINSLAEDVARVLSESLLPRDRATARAAVLKNIVNAIPDEVFKDMDATLAAK
jgi:hypothetical protein